jgi:hypothetical protein
METRQGDRYVAASHSLHSILTSKEPTIETLKDQIEFLERRLYAMADGDSAYEKLLIRYYGDMLLDRKALLRGLTAGV